MSNGKPGGIVIDFIDPLFAVVFHISFVEMMSKPWFSDFRLIFHRPYFFQLGTLFLAYVTIVNSWIGYHQSIQTKPIDVKNPWGMGRFVLDILLLISYFVLVASYENFRRELWILVVVFLIFILWDQAKRAETLDTSEESSARRGVTVVWFFVFLLFLIIYILPPLSELRPCLDGFILFAAIISNILYRVHKSYPKPKGLLLRLGIHKAHG